MDQGISGKLFHPRLGIGKLQCLPLALNKLHYLAAHQIDARDQHGSLTEIPAERIAALIPPMVCVPKCRMDAARAASARPLLKTSTKCCSFPAPPEAMTGM